MITTVGLHQSVLELAKYSICRSGALNYYCHCIYKFFKFYEQTYLSRWECDGSHSLTFSLTHSRPSTYCTDRLFCSHHVAYSLAVIRKVTVGTLEQQYAMHVENKTISGQCTWPGLAHTAYGSCRARLWKNTWQLLLVSVDKLDFVCSISSHVCIIGLTKKCNGLIAQQLPFPSPIK